MLKETRYIIPLPEWVKYTALDKDGSRIYAENKPLVKNGNNFWSVTTGKFECVPSGDDWKDSLEEL
jgi:hypothetical protein